MKESFAIGTSIFSEGITIELYVYLSAIILMK
jgi:hypothetical protein